MAKFFSRLSYSFGNEDWRTEAQALRICPQDQVLCITASGDRPLNLLMNDCQIVCVDANRIQNDLLELKMAAMQLLDYKEYLAFLGAIPGKERYRTLQRLVPLMSASASHYWLKQRKMIEKGVLYQGAVESLTKVVASLTTLLRGKKLEKLFSITDLEEQKKFVREEWDGYVWRKIFEVLLQPFLSRFLIKDPGLANVGKAINPGKYMYERIMASLERDLAKHNLLLSLLLKGQVYPEAFSPYLTAEGTDVIKSRLNQVNIFHSDIIDYIESFSAPTFDVFSLSDVISYLSHTEMERLLKGMVRTAKPGARFCLRQFLSSHDIPKDLQPYLVRDRGLEEKLEQQDNCFVYRFITGTVSSTGAEQKTVH